MRFVDKFVLSKGGEKIGDVVWYREISSHNSTRQYHGNFEASEYVLRALNSALEMAVNDKATYSSLPWSSIEEVIEHPEWFSEQLVAALEYAGFDPLPPDSSVMIQITGDGHHVNSLAY